MHLHDNRLPGSLIYLLTFFGQRGPVLIVTVPTVAYLVWRARSVEPLLRYAVALVALTVVVYGLKDAVGRTAPTLDLVRTSAGASYPSGHVANAVLMWGLLWWLAREAARDRMLTAVLVVVWVLGPVCVVVGMTLLDFHWISDYIAGAAIGAILLALVTHPVWRDCARPIDRRFARLDPAR